MSLIKLSFDFIESPIGLGLGDARRDVERAAQKFLDRHKNREDEAFPAWQSIVQDWKENLENEAAATILKILFRLMKVRIFIDDHLGFVPFRHNVENFPGYGEYRSYASYLFRTKPGADDPVSLLLEFKDGAMDWEESDCTDAIATLEFKNGKVLLEYLLRYVFSGDRDFLGHMLRNEVTLTGNSNYMLKFLFMINSMLLEVQKKLT